MYKTNRDVVIPAKGVRDVLKGYLWMRMRDPRSTEISSSESDVEYRTAVDIKNEVLKGLMGDSIPVSEKTTVLDDKISTTATGDIAGFKFTSVCIYTKQDSDTLASITVQMTCPHKGLEEVLNACTSTYIDHHIDLLMKSCDSIA